MILIDLEKALNTLNHKILLDEMNSIGFSSKTIKWFHSFLTNGAFFVSLDTVIWETGTINCRVPQGSILRPLLFLLYINDIPQALSNTHIHTCMQTIQVSFANISTLRKSKIFRIKYLQMYATGLLIINYQFILVKIKLNAFFSVGIKTYLILT